MGHVIYSSKWKNITMKKLAVLIGLVLTSSFLVAAENPARSAVKIISTQMDCFHFKVDKSFIGAEVVVMSTRGEKLLSETIKEKRTLLDLYYLQAGRYTVIIRYGQTEYTFDYNKTTSSPFVSAGPIG